MSNHVTCPSKRATLRLHSKWVEVDRILDVVLYSGVVCRLSGVPTDQSNRFIVDSGRDCVFEGCVVELVARELDFEVRRNLVFWSEPDVVTVVVHFALENLNNPSSSGEVSRS
jgi:hypothetical protein